MLLSTFSGLYLTSPWLFCSYPFVSLIPSPFHPAPRPAPLWQSALYALTCEAWGLLSSFLGGPQNSHMSGVQAVPLRWPYFSSDSTRRPRVVGRPHSIWLVGMQTIPIPRIWDTVSLTRTCWPLVGRLTFTSLHISRAFSVWLTSLWHSVGRFLASLTLLFISPIHWDF